MYSQPWSLRLSFLFEFLTQLQIAASFGSEPQLDLPLNLLSDPMPPDAGCCLVAQLSIPGDSAMAIRLIPPPCSDPLRHPIPEHPATPLRG
jgi:hypothetical protein